MAYLWPNKSIWGLFLPLIFGMFALVKNKNSVEFEEISMQNQVRKISRDKSTSDILVEPSDGKVQGSLIWLHGLGDSADVIRGVLTLGLDKLFRR